MTTNYHDTPTLALGCSDIARLTLVDARDAYSLRFCGDGSYRAHLLIGDDKSVPAHYRLVMEAKSWLKVFDDNVLIADLRTQHLNDTIEVYRAGEMGCLIKCPDGTVVDGCVF